MKLMIAAVAAATVTAGAANAQFAPVGEFYQVGEVEGDACALEGSRTLEGRATIYYRILYDGLDVANLYFVSEDWTARSGQSYDGYRVVFFEPDVSWNGTQTGFESNGRRGFMGSYPVALLDSFAKAKTMFIFKDDPSAEGGVATIFGVRLTGSGAAISRLRQCAAAALSRRTAREERERQVEHVVRDPFAEPRATETRPD